MKFAWTVLSILMISFIGCKRDEACTVNTPTSEEGQITAFAAANGISAVKHGSGVYYQIITPGSGSQASLASRVTVSYVGKFLNGNIFDQSANFTSQLNGLIEGWQIGIPLIRKGGTIKLIIPSAYGYGCNTFNGIPGSSVLYFEITLIDIQ
jgi:FKBP-type peptidyl-prolyl cis-trans isomerase FkpA